jgi:hypothetical protein
MKILMLFTLLTVTGVCLAQESSCQDFKEGKFYMKSTDGPRFIIIRKGNKQIEYIDGQPKKMMLRVKWIDDCTYTLKEPIFKIHKKGADLPKGTVLTVKITNTTPTYYEIRVTANFSDDFVTTSKMYRIE